MLNGSDDRLFGRRLSDLITGRVDFSWPTLSTSRSFLADGKLRALALDADARWAPLPDVPTLVELGYANHSPTPKKLAKIRQQAEQFLRSS